MNKDGSQSMNLDVFHITTHSRRQKSQNGMADGRETTQQERRKKIDKQDNRYTIDKLDNIDRPQSSQIHRPKGKTMARHRPR